MALKSNLLAGNARLEAAAVAHPSHITPGSRGPFVARIQAALQVLDGAEITASELAGQFYGPSTAAAVLAFKRGRSIINRSYQQSVDNIVGIMTMRQMDEELLAAQIDPTLRRGRDCQRPEDLDALRIGQLTRSDSAFVGGAAPVGEALPIGLPRALVG